MIKFSPSEVSQLTGISVDVLRDWRRRGFLNNIGTVDQSGRWTYNLGEVIQFLIVAEIKAFELDIEFAFKVAHDATQIVFAWMGVGGGVWEFEQKKVRFIAIFKSGGGLDHKYFAKIESILAFECSAFFALDASKIAKIITQNNPEMVRVLAQEFSDE